MPRRKKLPKIPDYTGIPKNENKLIVQKCHPLQTLSETDMSLAEFKILDAYLGKIDSHDDEKRYVRFEKGELERALGVTRISKENLHKRLKNLFQVVTIKDKQKKDGFTMIALFEKAEAFQDENGLWQIDLACTPAAMEYIFNVDSRGYLSYILKNITGLTSRYSYILYLYLENHRQSRLPNTWTISLDELKIMLRCNADTYSEYYRFNDLILKKCQKELNEKTTLHFSYEPCGKKARKYTEIRFTIETPLLDNQLEQLSFDEIEVQPSEPPSYSEHLAFLAEACDNAFSEEEMQVIFDIIVTLDIPTHPDGIDFARYHYLKQKYSEMKLQAAKRKITNRFAYFKAMLKQ